MKEIFEAADDLVEMVNKIEIRIPETNSTATF